MKAPALAGGLFFKSHPLMEELKSKTEYLTHSISNYLDTFYKLALVNLTQKATNLTSGIVAGLATLFLFVLTLFFLGISLALWLGSLVNSNALGFLIVAALFLGLIAAIVLLRKKIVFPMLKKAILKKLYE
jgi:hypothetical protein